MGLAIDRPALFALRPLAWHQNGKPRLYDKLQECVDMGRVVQYKRAPSGVSHAKDCQEMIKSAISKMELPSVTN